MAGWTPRSQSRAGCGSEEIHCPCQDSNRDPRHSLLFCNCQIMCASYRKLLWVWLCIRYVCTPDIVYVVWVTSQGVCYSTKVYTLIWKLTPPTTVYWYIWHATWQKWDVLLLESSKNAGASSLATVAVSQRFRPVPWGRYKCGYIFVAQNYPSAVVWAEICWSCSMTRKRI
jgi:hypothetical protein